VVNAETGINIGCYGSTRRVANSDSRNQGRALKKSDKYTETKNSINLINTSQYFGPGHFWIY